MVVMGRIVAPFGIKGWVKVQPFADDAPDWGEMPEWWLASSDDAPEDTWKSYALRECKAHGNILVAALEGVDDRNASEALKGMFVGAPRSALPETTEDEFYWADLTGLAVVNTADESLGTVAGLMSTGAHDILQVVDGEVERLIPFVKAYVLEVDKVARLIRVDWQKDW